MNKCVHTDNKNYICPYCHFKKIYVKADNSVGMKAVFMKEDV